VVPVALGAGQPTLQDLGAEREGRLAAACSRRLRDLRGRDAGVVEAMSIVAPPRRSQATGARVTLLPAARCPPPRRSQAKNPSGTRYCWPAGHKPGAATIQEPLAARLQLRTDRLKISFGAAAITPGLLTRQGRCTLVHDSG
jgi:hypothetical protein